MDDAPLLARFFPRTLTAMAAIAALVVLAMAILMQWAERDAQPEAFGAFAGALWWSVQTLTGLGYGDLVPTTPQGKLVATLAMVAGFVFRVFAIALAAAWLLEGARRHRERA